MTPERKKEIETQIDKMLLFYHGTKCFKDYLLEMAEWADEHPQKGLISLDRACEYLESVFTSLTGYYSGAEHTDDFRKAMEREPES